MTRFVVGAVWFIQALTISAATFTSDTYIGPTDFSSDGEDIVVTNCTLTVDGAHGFNSLQLQNGGVLTHSAFTNGPGQIPYYVINESQTLSDTNPATLLNTNVDTNTIVVRDSSATITYTPNVDYVILSAYPYTELELTTNSAIAEGTNVLVSYTWDQNYLGFTLSISNDVQVLAGGSVNIQGKGYAGGSGPGAGTSQSTNYPYTFTAGGGGGHGGCGGMSSTFAFGGGSYDSTTNPASLGSGGGTGSTNGGAGGGLAQLFVGGTLELDGQILADGLDGTNRHSGGGAGGGLLISAETLVGAGSITANGGAGDLPDGGGGGAGCIAVYFGTNNFTGSITAFGGAGAMYGGAGTIFTQSFTDPAGQLLIANAGVAGTNTSFSTNAAISNLTISGGAIAQSSGFTATNLFIGSNSSLVPIVPGSLVMTINGNAAVDSNATINADLASEGGPGSGFFGCASGTGGGYGGYGGAGAGCARNGGMVYGSITQPSSLGSSGAGTGSHSPGGGAVVMTVAGTLSLSGGIHADGASAVVGSSAGGGSGGSVWLTVGTFVGNGLITASGGGADTLAGGGGGGGRIAIYFNTNQFTGSMAARGGVGANAGGPGTVYLLTNGSTFAQLTIDNAGLTGFTAFGSAAPLSDLTISGGSTVSNYDGNTAVLRNLFIGSNSWLSAWSSTILRITTTNVTIQPSGGITMDGVSSSGPGAGGSFNNTGGGGGNAGNGGNSTSGAFGGTGNNFIIGLADTTGGIGGTGVNGAIGGAGGGVMSLTVAGKLQVDGAISANGVAGPALNSGGGAGGSILLNVGTLSGSGIISVNGGAGNNLVGGGGGGGYLNVTSATNQFSGIIMARGGTGGNPGGAGFVYLLQNLYPFQQSSVTSDNGGLRAGLTPLSLNDLPPGLSLNITGGAVVSNINSGMNVGNLLIGSNSTFLAGAFTSQQTYSTGTNATIQAGGSLSADGINNNVGSEGQGQLYGGGGSYGGSGGAGTTNFGTGGPIFDSLTAPSFEGGHGAASSTGSAGGNGGGSLRIIVNGKLQLDGRISAQGAAPTNSGTGGGGAGGSIWLSAEGLAGAGAISVNGGAGGVPAGGGGGGRIALYYNSNSFTGSISAYGGPGINYGGAGTVYITSAFSGPGQFTQLTIDNGGASGNTFLNSFPTGLFNFTVTGADTTALTNSLAPAFQNFLLGSNSTFICYPFSQPEILVLTNATIQAGARFIDDGASTSVGGQTLNQTGGGGGHGGYGGASLSNALGGTVTSESVTQPIYPGTRGGAGFQGLVGGNGGGAFELNVNGTLRVDGKISSDGLASTAANGGGGAGGSVYLSVGTLSGAGTISANGGAGNNVGGGGGGGRVALSCKTNLYSGTFAAHGGAGGHFGGAGTICLPVLGPPVVPPGEVQVIVDNGGNRGTNTLLSGLPSSSTVTVNSGGSVTLQGSASLASLTISSNAVLTAIAGSDAVLSLSAGNLTIQPGGAITLDGSGFPANGGSGHGFSASSGAGGGGHGGYGSSGINVAGGSSYDSITTPSQAGSGGGSTGLTSGSAGGGALQLSVNGVLQVDGAITANGASAATNGSGGGAGGSLWINTRTLSGAGNISANGGNGDLSSSGGGGGGRIAIYFTGLQVLSNGFTGTLSARGGAGVGPSGGAGTIFLETNSAAFNQLIVDNGGSSGTNTPLASLTSPVNLVLRNGAEADSTAPLTLQSLSINSRAVFNADSLAPLNLTVLGGAFVDSNAFIIADDAGYDSGSNNIGSGSVDFFGDGGGGGYGGTGGESLYGAAGGGTYGSSNQPVDFGSAGGTSPTLAGFSQGGGAIRLLVDGALTLNGTVSANGNDGVIEGAGGGSGGSIWITTSSLSGTGNIVANGGTGQDGQGGGGGGGRIAIYASANSFAGSASVNGGNGASLGQPGTIVIATNLLVSGSVTDTNGTGIAGVTLQPNGLASVTTDNSGAYSVATPLFWTGSVTPTSPGLYLPSLRNYSDISSNVANQNFILALPSDFNFTGSEFDGTNNAGFSWYGINGVSYQPLVSSNLLDWAPYGPPITGTNGPAMFLVPVSDAPQQFFRLNVNYY